VLKEDPLAFGVIMKKYHNMVDSLGHKFINDPDEREDFVQDVFIQIYQSLSQFRGEAQLSTWIYQIARNKLTRNSKTEKAISIDDHNRFDSFSLSTLQKWKAFKLTASHESALFKEEIQTKIRSLVSNLPNQYKKPIMLYYFDDLSYKEIADKLNLKMNTLKSYLHRGKELLKELFHEKDSES
jgi:RNA polymerase sigma-70 factor, ECF subfamily